MNPINPINPVPFAIVAIFVAVVLVNNMPAPSKLDRLLVRTVTAFFILVIVLLTLDVVGIDLFPRLPQQDIWWRSVNL